MTWSFFAPAEDWQHPKTVSDDSLELIEYIGQRMHMRCTRNEEHKKIYLGQAGAPAPARPADPPSGSGSPADGFLYPSGKRFAKARLSEAEAARYGTTGEYQAAPLLEIHPEDPVSDHFRAGEFFCHDTSYRFLRVSAELLRRLEQLRAVVGRPLTVLSGFRPPVYNKSIGGVSNSAHIDGLAADVTCAGVDTATLHALAEPIFADGGLGYYPVSQFIHCDVRGSRARWTG